MKKFVSLCRSGDLQKMRDFYTCNREKNNIKYKNNIPFGTSCIHGHIEIVKRLKSLNYKIRANYDIIFHMSLC